MIEMYAEETSISCFMFLSYQYTLIIVGAYCAQFFLFCRKRKGILSKTVENIFPSLSEIVRTIHSHFLIVVESTIAFSCNTLPLCKYGRSCGYCVRAFAAGMNHYLICQASICQCGAVKPAFNAYAFVIL